MNPLTGEQRYRQARLKAWLIGARQLRQFMAGEIDFLPGIREREAIIAEFDRLIAEINTCRTALAEHEDRQ